MKNPGKVRARTYGTKLPGRSEALRFIDSAKSPSTPAFARHVNLSHSWFVFYAWYCLRGAWRDHRFPEPFSWFLHETGLESLKITSARCFLLNVKGKSRKKRKNTAGFVASLGAGVQPRSTVQLFMPVSGVEKPPFSQFFFSALGCHLARKSLSWPAMSLSNKKQEFEQRKQIKLFDDFWVRA